jgi:uncharacterized protein YhbP (UPF0306 family)
MPMKTCAWMQAVSTIKKYPFALAIPGDVYTIQPDYIKLTDNTIGFGKKLTWLRNEVNETEQV